MPGPASLKRLVAAGTLALGGWAAAAEAKIVYLDMDVELDQVAPEDAKMFRVGGHDLDRIAYDDSTVDPLTHKVRLTYLAHFIMGRCMPDAVGGRRGSRTAREGERSFDHANAIGDAAKKPVTLEAWCRLVSDRGDADGGIALHRQRRGFSEHQRGDAVAVARQGRFAIAQNIHEMAHFPAVSFCVSLQKEVL